MLDGEAMGGGEGKVGIVAMQKRGCVGSEELSMDRVSRPVWVRVASKGRTRLRQVLRQ